MRFAWLIALLAILRADAINAAAGMIPLFFRFCGMYFEKKQQQFQQELLNEKHNEAASIRENTIENHPSRNTIGSTTQSFVLQSRMTLKSRPEHPPPSLLQR